MSEQDAEEERRRSRVRSEALKRTRLWASAAACPPAEAAEREEALHRIEAFLSENPSDETRAALERAKIRWGLFSHTILGGPVTAEALDAFVEQLVSSGYATVQRVHEFSNTRPVFIPITEHIPAPELLRMLSETEDTPVLDLSFLPTLTSLPPLHELFGTLNAIGAVSVATLDEGLVVHGSLALRDSALRELPERLEVRGSLHLRGCAQLQLTRSLALVHVEGAVDMSATGLTQVPDDIGLVCGGALDLDSCERLESIGAGLRIGASLNARFCPRLTSLSGVMSVGTYVELQGCDALVELPRDLPIRGGLGASHCRLLRALPSAVRDMDGNLFAANLPELEAAPPDLERVGKILNLATCVQLRALPPRLREVGMLELSDCAALEELPEGLRVHGDCNMVRCRALRSLPAGLSVGGDLDLTACEALQELPPDLEVAGDLELFGAISLRSLPPGLRARVGGNVTAWNCPNLVLDEDMLHFEHDVVLSFRRALSWMPAGLRVDGDLWVSGTSLAALPARLRVGGDLLGSHNALLREVGADLDVSGNVELRGCTSLRRVGNGLQVAGSVDFAGCEALTEIGNGLSAGELDLRGCTALTGLPDDLEVDSALVLDGCTGITAVPSCVFAWRPLQPLGDRVRHVYLAGSGVPQAEVERLVAAGAGAVPGVQFHSQRQRTVFELFARFLLGGAEAGDGGGNFDDPAPFASLAEAAQFWASAAAPETADDEQPPAAVDLEPHVDNGSRRGVLLFLSKMRMSKEFQDEASRKGLAARVVEALAAVRDDAFARDELVARMGDAVDACGDKPVWALNQMTLLARVARARGNRDALRALGRGIMRLAVVHEHAARILAARPDADDVSVFLRFEIALQESLELPVSARDMLFPRAAPVTPGQLAAAEREALGVPDADFERWLLAWPEWQRQLRHEAAQRMRWTELPRNSRRFSLSWSDLFGNADVQDPVRVDKKGTVWSLQDLLRHWVATGLDLNNQARSLQEMQGLSRCRSLPRKT